MNAYQYLKPCRKDPIASNQNIGKCSHNLKENKRKRDLQKILERQNSTLTRNIHLDICFLTMARWWPSFGAVTTPLPSSIAECGRRSIKCISCITVEVDDSVQGRLYTIGQYSSHWPFEPTIGQCSRRSTVYFFYLNLLIF